VKIDIELSDTHLYDVEGPSDIKKVIISNSEYEGCIVLSADGKQICLFDTELIEAIKRCSGSEAVRNEQFKAE